MAFVYQAVSRANSNSSISHSMRKIGNPDFSTKTTNCYNPGVIISVGYRVKSHQGTKFRQWAMARLREHIVKGFTMNDELLKQASGGNYFEELLFSVELDYKPLKINYLNYLHLPYYPM